MPNLNELFGKIGGKKLAALGVGIVLWLLGQYTAVPVQEISAGVDAAQEISSAPSIKELFQMIIVYIGAQGLADGLSKGATSSVATLKE